MKQKQLLLIFIILVIMLAGCKSEVRNVDSTAIITAGPSPASTPTPLPTEPPITASDILDESKAALDEVWGYAIEEQFELELSGGMNDAYARRSSTLEYNMIGKSHFKVLGEERTDRDAGSNDKVTRYRLYGETNDEGILLLQTRSDGTWSKEQLGDEGRQGLDHIAPYLDIIERSARAEYMDIDTVDGISAHVIEYPLTPDDIRARMNRLAEVSVPIQLLGADNVETICNNVAMNAVMYVDTETMLPYKLTIDYTDLQQAMTDVLGIDIEIVTAHEESVITNYNDVDTISVPASAEAAYKN